MRSSLGSEYLHISLSIQECLAAADGNVIGDSINPIFLDAKVEVRRLEECVGEERQRVVEAGTAIAQLFSNEDLALFIPTEALRMSYVARVVIGHDQIVGSNVEPDYLEHYRNQLPPEGIEVNFDGSMRVVDLSQQFTL